MVPTYDAAKTTKYTLITDTEEVKTEFHLGVLDAKAESYLNTEYTSITMKGTGKRDSDNRPEMEPNVAVNRTGKDIETVMLALKGVTNFAGTLTFTEKNYPFGKRTVLSDASLNLIKPYIGELADAIREASELTSEAIKN